jgi:hypothetical protein
MRPKIAMWSDYGTPRRKHWRARSRRSSSIGPRILVAAVVVVAGVIGISGIYLRGTSTHSQRVFDAAPESVGMGHQLQPLIPARPAWVVQLIGDSSETAALSRFHQMQGKLQSVLGGYEPAILRTTLKPGEAPTWVRVRIEFDTRQGADSLCSKLEAAGERCLVQRNSER